MILLKTNQVIIYIFQKEIITEIAEKVFLIFSSINSFIRNFLIFVFYKILLIFMVILKDKFILILTDNSNRKKLKTS